MSDDSLPSTDIFDYLNDFYDLLPEQDRLRFGETWKAYEQTYGNIWTKLMERRLSVNIDTVPLYNNYRWLSHVFDSTTAVDMAAQFQATPDLSNGIDTTNFFLLNIALNGGTPIQFSIQGKDPLKTKASEIVDAINNAFGFSFASLDVNGALLFLQSDVSGPASSIEFLPASVPANDAAPTVLGLSVTSLPVITPTFPYQYQLGDPAIVGIPALQDKIHDDQVTTLLEQNTDFVIQFGTGIISFKEVPPSSMWAKDTLINKETPYNNFGYLMSFYAPNTPQYLKAVQGLWFAFWTGPKPSNIERCLYLLFGLPTASQAGTVTVASDTKVVVQYTDLTTETFAVPAGLIPIVAVGDTVTKYQPLVSGILVYDKVNSPGFLAREVGRIGVQPFLTQYATRGPGPDTDETRALKILEQNTFLPQIDVNAFINNNISLANVRTFLLNIKPVSRTYLFQIVAGIFNDSLGGSFGFQEFVGLDVSIDVTANVDGNENTWAQQSDLDDAETDPDTGIHLNTDWFMCFEGVDIEVYNNGSLVDSFSDWS